MATTNIHGQDHFGRLPVELFQTIIDRLPLKDTWKLRSVSRSWNAYLSSDNAKTRVVARWNAHKLDDIAPICNNSVRTVEEHFMRAQRFLSGQPYAYVEMTRIAREAPFVLKGKWFIHALGDRYDHIGPVFRNGGNVFKALCIWDLSTGRQRVLGIEQVVITQIVASVECVAWNGTVKRQDGTFADELCIVRLSDLESISHEVNLAGLFTSERFKLAADGQWVILASSGVHASDEGPGEVNLVIVDCNTGETRTISWRMAGTSDDGTLQSTPKISPSLYVRHAHG